MTIPGVRVDRAAFLKKELFPHCSERQVLEAIEGRPALAGIPGSTLRKIARGCINLHTTRATTISFANAVIYGLPVYGYMPVDISQFYYHVIVLIQKLAYLYGWPEFIKGREVDDQTLLDITLFVGVMFGSQGAKKGVITIAARRSGQVATRLPKKALTKFDIYNVAKQIAKWRGVKMTRNTLSQMVAKAVPILGGVISRPIIMATFRLRASILRHHLSHLSLARG